MTSKCKDCGAAIIWATNPRGKSIPLDATPKTCYRVEGPPGLYTATPTMMRSCHFDTCPSRSKPFTAA